MAPVLSDVHRHNWVTYLLSKLFLRTRERRISYMLYAYLRQVDDYIDESGADQDVCLQYLHTQRARVKNLYTNGTARVNSFLDQIIEHDRNNGHRFEECIDLMMDVFEFDAQRRHCLVSADKLQSYSITLARAYTQFLVSLIEPGYQYTRDDVLLAHACHRAHMIRDLYLDNDLGYINIAKEDIETYALQPGHYTGTRFSGWLQKEMTHIENLLKQGKRALCRNRTLTIKIMGLLYCFRYEVILRRIKTCGFTLRKDYPIKFFDGVRLVFKCIGMCMKHFFQCFSL